MRRALGARALAAVVLAVACLPAAAGGPLNLVCGGTAPLVTQCATAPFTLDWHMFWVFEFPPCGASVAPLSAATGPCFVGALEHRFSWPGGEATYRCQATRLPRGSLEALDACAFDGDRLPGSVAIEHACATYVVDAEPRIPGGVGEWQCRLYRAF